MEYVNASENGGSWSKKGHHYQESDDENNDFQKVRLLGFSSDNIYFKILVAPIRERVRVGLAKIKKKTERTHKTNTASLKHEKCTGRLHAAIACGKVLEAERKQYTASEKLMQHKVESWCSSLKTEKTFGNASLKTQSSVNLHPDKVPTKLCSNRSSAGMRAQVSWLSRIGL